MTEGTGIISGVSVSHSHATVEQIEATCAPDLREAIGTLLDHDDVSEAFVLQTCNRAEAYVVADDAETGREVLDAYLSAPGGAERGSSTDRPTSPDPSIVRELGHEASLRHLMRVACGLESLVLGEDQILGQVRDAYEVAREAGSIGTTLEEALLKAIHVGERAREETTINEGAVSIGSAAIRLAATERDLEDATAAVVGAGEMAVLAARSLDGTADQIVVVNRTLANAESVVEDLDSAASAAELEELPEVVGRADLLVTATGSDEPVVEGDLLAAAGETLVIDIAQPRDVSPNVGSLDGVTVYDLDAIESVTDETQTQRREAAEAVEVMIDEEFDRLIDQYKRKRADQVIAAMYEGAERIKARELRTAFARLEAETDGEVTDAQREVVESLADALVGQLLSAPTESLRNAAENDDWSTINTALLLFDPDFESGSAEVYVPDGPDQLPEEARRQMSAAVLEQLTASTTADGND